MFRKIVLLVVVSIGFSILGAGLSTAQESDSTKEIPQSISLTADIAPSKKVQVVPEVNGTLEEISVDLGSQVKKGEVVARIDSKDIALQVKQAEAGLLSAQANYRKAETMSRIQAETNFKRAEAAFQSAQAQWNLTESTAETEFFSNLKQAEAALKIAQANLSKAKEGARTEEVAQVEAAYQQALANFHNAEKELQRAKDDYSRGAIPEQALDKAKLSYEVAQAQLASAKANLELIKKGARDEDIQIAEANVKQAQASLENLEKMKETESWKVKIEGARAQLENARSSLKVASVSLEEKLWEEDIQLAKAQLEQAKASLELAKSRLEDCTIRAPISGIVEQRFADEGSLVGPGQPLLSIVDISSVKIVLHIGEEYLDDIPLTKKVAVSIENYLDEIFTPQEINISPTMDPRSRKIKVEVVIPNPDLRIKPGMFARVKLLFEEQ